MAASASRQRYQTGREIGSLFSSEEWWRDHYHHIRLNGYLLRHRYNPDWRPSWKRPGKFFSAEDERPTILRAAMDAIRKHDGKQVMLKKVIPEEGPHELRIAQLFSSPELVRDPCNDCVPLLDVIEIPTTGQKLMVMPLLRPFNNPHFQTFGEFVAFFIQICEGLEFMHQRNIAHRGCTSNNLMFDPSGMYPQGFHPAKMNRSRDFKGRAKRYTRTQRPPRYYLIDFGLSRRYTSRDVLDEPLRGGDRSAPEHQDGQLCNPFHTDIYYLGNLVWEEFIRKYDGFEFMEDLVKEMTDENPSKRPLIEDVIAKFSRVLKSLSGLKLRAAIVSKHKPNLFVIFRRATQALRTFGYLVSRKAAIPRPRSHVCSLEEHRPAYTVRYCTTRALSTKDMSMLVGGALHLLHLEAIKRRRTRSAIFLGCSRALHLPKPPHTPSKPLLRYIATTLTHCDSS